jgi:hypothetical protein
VTHVVKVHEITCEIVAARHTSGSRIVWVAVGSYLGKQFKGTGLTEDSAVYSWYEQARTSVEDGTGKGATVPFTSILTNSGCQLLTHDGGAPKVSIQQARERR